MKHDVLPALSANAVIHRRPDQGARDDAYEACVRQ